MNKGHPVRGALTGLLFGGFLTLFLLTIGVVPLDSILVIVLPVAFLLAGIGLGIGAPFKRDRAIDAASSAGSTSTP